MVFSCSLGHGGDVQLCAGHASKAAPHIIPLAGTTGVDAENVVLCIPHNKERIDLIVRIFITTIQCQNAGYLIAQGKLGLLGEIGFQQIKPAPSGAVYCVVPPNTV